MNSTLTKPASQTPAGNGVHRPQYLIPAANVRDDKDGYVLEAEMPGVPKDGLELTVENGELVIIGRRSAVQSSGKPVYRESRQLDYRRAFELDPSIDTTKITAKLEQGVLTLHLPKAEAVKPRKISVS
ncbi:MAG: Hsp20/alpha crystallin family protein [Chthoniobacteraceae bacterium]